jgi:hypothetical protein
MIVGAGGGRIDSKFRLCGEISKGRLYFGDYIVF